MSKVSVIKLFLFLFTRFRKKMQLGARSKFEVCQVLRNNALVLKVINPDTSYHYYVGAELKNSILTRKESVRKKFSKHCLAFSRDVSSNDPVNEITDIKELYKHTTINDLQSI